MVIKVFWTLVVLFFLVTSEFFIPWVRDLLRDSMLFLLPIFVFFLAGVALLFFTLREKVGKKLKKFLLLTGGGATGFFLSILLHNFLYALGVMTSHLPLLSGFFEILHAIFFMIAVFVCPIVFLVGMIGTIVLLLREKK